MLYELLYGCDDILLSSRHFHELPLSRIPRFYWYSREDIVDLKNTVGTARKAVCFDPAAADRLQAELPLTGLSVPVEVDNLDELVLLHISLKITEHVRIPPHTRTFVRLLYANMRGTCK